MPPLSLSLDRAEALNVNKSIRARSSNIKLPLLTIKSLFMPPMRAILVMLAHERPTNHLSLSLSHTHLIIFPHKFPFNTSLLYLILSFHTQTFCLFDKGSEYWQRDWMDCDWYLLESGLGSCSHYTNMLRVHLNEETISSHDQCQGRPLSICPCWHSHALTGSAKSTYKGQWCV